MAIHGHSSVWLLHWHRADLLPRGEASMSQTQGARVYHNTTLSLLWHVQWLQDVGGLVLLSPYTSIRDMVGEVLPKKLGGMGKMAGYLISNRFNNANEVRDVKCPVLIIHGKQDKLIPHSHSEILHKVDMLFAEIECRAQAPAHTSAYLALSELRRGAKTVVPRGLNGPLLHHGKETHTHTPTPHTAQHKPTRTRVHSTGRFRVFCALSHDGLLPQQLQKGR